MWILSKIGIVKIPTEATMFEHLGIDVSMEKHERGETRVLHNSDTQVAYMETPTGSTALVLDFEEGTFIELIDLEFNTLVDQLKKESAERKEMFYSTEQE